MIAPDFALLRGLGFHPYRHPAGTAPAVGDRPHRPGAPPAGAIRFSKAVQGIHSTARAAAAMVASVTAHRSSPQGMGISTGYSTPAST